MMSTGLFIAPGGLRNVATAGMLAAFQQEEFLDQFDYVIGASSGATNALYVTHPNIAEATAGFWTHALPYLKEDNNFSFKRLLKGKPPMGVEDFIRHHCFSEAGYPADKGFLDSKLNQTGRFIITCLDVVSGHPIYFSNFQTQEALIKSLSASSYLPLFSGINPYVMTAEILSQVDVYDHQGKRIFPDKLFLSDGGTADYFGLNAAHVFGITKRIHLDSQHRNDYYKDNFALLPKGLRRVENQITKRIFHKYPRGQERYNQMVLKGGLQREALSLLNEDLILPLEDTGMSMGNKNAARMKKAAVLGWKSAYQFMQKAEKEIPQEWV